MIGSSAMLHRAALLAALLASGACGFDSRSGQFECGSGGSCDGDRVCVDGWCVVEGSVPAADVDVGPFTCDDSGCTLVCGDGECGGDVHCPAGRPCTVECNGDDSCAGGIDCDDASACRILCSGDGACDDEVDCGPGRCTVECSGDDACSGGVDCDDACACDLTCDGPGSCSGATECARPQQCQEGNECVTTGGPCDQC
jgi:hypothetical protein